MRGRRAERREGNPNVLERIGGGEGGNRVFKDEVPVDEILTVVVKGRNAQKVIHKVGDRHLPREKVGTDEPGQDVEGEGGTFRGARAIEVDYPQKPLDNKEEIKGPPQAR